MSSSSEDINDSLLSLGDMTDKHSRDLADDLIDNNSIHNEEPPMEKVKKQFKANENPRDFNANDVVNILGITLTFPNDFSIECADAKDWEGNNTISDNAGCFVVNIGDEQIIYKYSKKNDKIYRWVCKIDSENYARVITKERKADDNDNFDVEKKLTFHYAVGVPSSATDCKCKQRFFDEFGDKDLKEMPNFFWENSIKDDENQSLARMEIEYEMKVRDFKTYYELEDNSDYLIDKNISNKLIELSPDDKIIINKNFKFGFQHFVEIQYPDGEKEVFSFGENPDKEIYCVLSGHSEQNDFDYSNKSIDEIKKFSIENNNFIKGYISRFSEKGANNIDIKEYLLKNYFRAGKGINADIGIFNAIKDFKYLKFFGSGIKDFQKRFNHTLSCFFVIFNEMDGYGVMSSKKAIFEGRYSRSEMTMKNGTEFKVLINKGNHFFTGIIEGFAGGYANKAHPEGHGVFTMGSDDEIEIFGKKILFRKGEKIECDHWTNFKEINPGKITVNGHEVDARTEGIEIKITGTDGKERIITVKEDAITHNIGFTENNNGTQVVINEEQVSPSINKENEEKKIDNELQQFIKDNNLNQDINNNEPTVSSNIDLSKPRTHYKNNTNNTNNTNTNEQPKLSIPDDNKQQGAGEPKFNPLLAMLLLITIIGFILYVINYLSDYKKWKEVNNKSDYNNLLINRLFV